MNIKKILQVIVFAIFVGLMAFALYWVFFRSEPADDANTNFVGGDIPGIGPGNITVIDNTNDFEPLPWEQYVQDQVSDVANGGLTAVTNLTDSRVNGVFAGQTGLQFYDEEQQQFFYIDANGDMHLLSNEKFYGVDNVTWAGNGNKAILEYPDGSNILYHFGSGKQVTLPHEMEDFSFNSAANQIVAKFIGQHEDDNWLVGANDDGSGLFLIEPLGDQSHTTHMDFSPDNQVAALHSKYIDSQRQEIYPIGLHGENFKSFVVNGAGFTSEWSPSGDSLLYSIYSESTNYTPNLWVTKGNTNELGDLKVSLNVATWPDKCTFAGESNMYCAVPQGLPRGAGFYPEIADEFNDNFYQIDLNTGIKTLIASPVGPNGSYTASNLFLSADGSILYFTDKITGELQSIRLE